MVKTRSIVAAGFRFGAKMRNISKTYCYYFQFVLK
jgi:hypothetical protein